MADIGHGTTVTFGTSGFTATLRSVSGPNIQVDSVDSSNTGTTYQVREFIPGMMDAGELTLEIIFDPDAPADNFPFSDAFSDDGWSDATGVTETITITWPTPYDMSTPANWSADGFITAIQPEAPLDDLMTASVTVKLSGGITFTAAS